MATKTQKTNRNKQTFIKGKMGVPPWNGQRNLNRELLFWTNCCCFVGPVTRK